MRNFTKKLKSFSANLVVATQDKQTKMNNYEKVEHINGDKLDNRVENLRIIRCKYQDKQTKMSSKKVVVATYDPQSVFKIPKNIDLEDKSIVKDWGVKWDILYITLVKDDEQLRIEPHFIASEHFDFKYATDTTIEDAEKWFGEEEDEEEEEEEEEKEEEKEEEEEEEEEKEITELKNKIAEYEAVEQYIMKTIRNGGEYDDILKAHYREGKVVDGEWVDDKEEEEEKEESTTCERCEETFDEDNLYIHSFGCVRLCNACGEGQCVGTSEQDDCDICRTEEEEEEEEEKDDGSNTCYGVETRNQKTFKMSGGHGDWFNYVVVFDDDGEQKAVYIETKNRLELCEDQRLVQTFNKHGDERIKCVYNNYELNEDKEECWIYNY